MKKFSFAFILAVSLLFWAACPAWSVSEGIFIRWDNWTNVNWSLRVVSDANEVSAVMSPGGGDNIRRQLWGSKIKEVIITRANDNLECDVCPSVKECRWVPASPIKVKAVAVTVYNDRFSIRIGRESLKASEVVKTCP